MKDLEWNYQKGLNELYKTERTTLKILNNAFIRQVLFKQKRLIKYKMGNQKVLETTKRFNPYYEEHYKEIFEYYNEFFEKSGIKNTAQKKYNILDLKTLVFIFNNKEELKKTLTTEYTFSTRVFKGQGAKYLSNRSGLKQDVLKLLGVDEFPENDPKNNFWRIVVDCETPKVIVLCENIACLKVPVEYKKRGIELWYVGGNNTKPLLDLPLEKINYPIYYFCDWDYHGLKNFSRIKEIFESKKVSISLLEPKDLENSLPVDSPHHNSKWVNKELSNLERNDFTETQIDIIKQLINKDKWVEEESMELIELLKIQKII